MKRDSVSHWEALMQKEKRGIWSKEGEKQEGPKSSFMENFERLGHELDKEDEGEEVKGFSVFFFEN